MLYEQIVSSMPINKGWSVDQKYCVFQEVHHLL